jgi:hypothetical protein
MSAFAPVVVAVVVTVDGQACCFCLGVCQHAGRTGLQWLWRDEMLRLRLQARVHLAMVTSRRQEVNNDTV